MFVDLHVHSVFSDGCLTPRQLAADALRAQVSLIALADHNTLAGSGEMRKECALAGIRCINAVEIDTIYEGEDLHILAYDADPSRKEFAELVCYSREMLDRMSTDLIAAMQADGQPVLMRDYLAYPEQKGRGGWKALYYLQDCGACANIYEVFPLYERYGVTYAKAGFVQARDVIRTIHDAGGLAVLAHPGDVNRRDQHIEADEMVRQMTDLFNSGLDGAECHYPKHSPAETKLFENLCRAHGRLITSGSDCHGAFSGKPVGYMQKTIDDLVLGELLKRAK